MKTILLLAIALCSALAHATDRTVVMISLDGARPDYFSQQETPNIYGMGQRGWGLTMRPIFPTITFPNHAALATGCTAEQHGIVSNSFRDPRRGAFDMSPDATWMMCEPMWITAEKAGMKSAIALWPMSWTSWHGVRASYYFPAEPKNEKAALNTSVQSRFDQIIAWLKLPEDQRPHLILSWLGEIDHAGHSHGPDSAEVRNTVRKYDHLIGEFLKQLRRLPVGKTTDVIVVSDHGMSTTKNYISLDYLTLKLAEVGIVLSAIEHSGPLAMIYLPQNPGKVIKAEKLLARIGTEGAVFSAYAQDSLPADWRFRSPRSGQIVLMARGGFVFTNRGKGETLLYIPKTDAEKGNHGYPPETPEMQAIFFAEGPDFPKDQSPAQWNTMDVAPMIKKILFLSTEIGGSTPAPR